MIKDKYLKQVRQQVNQFNRDKKLKFFIFGSSLEKGHFGDLDLGVIGPIKRQELYQLKEKFEASNLPYFIDIVNFNKVSKDFKENVFNNKILWLTPSN